MGGGWGIKESSRKSEKAIISLFELGRWGVTPGLEILVEVNPTHTRNGIRPQKPLMVRCRQVEGLRNEGDCSLSDAVT